MSPGKSGKNGLRSGGSMWQRVALGPGLMIGQRDSRWRDCPKIASAAVGKVREALPSLTDSHLRLTVATTKSVAATSWLGRFEPSCICRSLAHPNGPLRPFKLVMQWTGLNANVRWCRKQPLSSDHRRGANLCFAAAEVFTAMTVRTMPSESRTL